MSGIERTKFRHWKHFDVDTQCHCVYYFVRPDSRAEQAFWVGNCSAWVSRLSPQPQWIAFANLNLLLSLMRGWVTAQQQPAAHNELLIGAHMCVTLRWTTKLCSSVSRHVMEELTSVASVCHNKPGIRVILATCDSSACVINRCRRPNCRPKVSTSSPLPMGCNQYIAPSASTDSPQ